MADVENRFAELQTLMKTKGGYFKLSKEEKKEYQSLKKQLEKPEVKQTPRLEVIKDSLWNKIKDGESRALILAMNPDLPLQPQLEEVRDRMLNGTHKGYVQNFIDQL